MINHIHIDDRPLFSLFHHGKDTEISVTSSIFYIDSMNESFKAASFYRDSCPNNETIS